ncbi:hypothetical protein [Ferrovibrio terrae]|uniref:hypothetical protein n=1 Tax=Ferrovibrio terrae TaxID=2594003 RepID=UPI0031378232
MTDRELSREETSALNRRANQLVQAAWPEVRLDLKRQYLARTGSDAALVAIEQLTLVPPAGVAPGEDLTEFLLSAPAEWWLIYRRFERRLADRLSEMWPQRVRP